MLKPLAKLNLASGSDHTAAGMEVIGL